MSTRTRRVRDGVFTALVVSSLGFGASQAFARPASADVASKRACLPNVCNRSCVISGYTGGVCDPDAGCSCYY